MARRPNPLVPLDLFRQRAFATINLATFFIYGALYVTISYQALVLQDMLGYTALAAGAIGVPTGILLSVLSTRVGTLAGRLGARRFLVAGPLLMAAAHALVRAPAGRLRGLEGRLRAPRERSSRRSTPGSTCVPAVLLFGVGISLVVAPLTSTLMDSLPSRFSGLGSAINNSISRVGQPLLGAIIFVAISATFYASLGSLSPGLDTADADRPPTSSSRSTRRPRATAHDQLVAATQASMDAFHLACPGGRRPARHRRARVVGRPARPGHDPRPR